MGAWGSRPREQLRQKTTTVWPDPATLARLARSAQDDESGFTRADGWGSRAAFLILRDAPNLVILRCPNPVILREVAGSGHMFPHVGRVVFGLVVVGLRV